jgi:uncharacterized protein (TIGR03118 family)
MALKHFTRIVSVCTAVIVMAGTASLRGDSGSFYVQHNLVSDIKGAARTDIQLVNAWGIDASPTGPWWVNSNGKGLSIVYDSTGAAFPAMSPIVVTIPPPGSGTPTGIVFNVFNGSGDFPVTSGNPAIFIFASEDGAISAWNPNVNMSLAMVRVPASAANVYKGLAIGQAGVRKLLYAANFRTGAVDIFDTNFAPVIPSTLSPNAFIDLTIPPGFAPFNVQNINGSIFVTYAMQDGAKHDDVAGPGNGFVDQFMTDGTLVRRLQHGNWFNSPWGVAMAPANFGDLSGRLLIGNFGSGEIASFDPGSGNFKSMMLSHGNHPVVIDGLWGLKFGNGATAGPLNVLFFAAGIQGESHGLFGTLRAKHEDDQGGDDQGDNENSHGKNKH